MNVPSSIQLQVVSQVAPMLNSAQSVDVAVRPDGSTGDVTVGRDIYNPYEDETPADYRPPADPRRWKADPAATAAAPGGRGAVDGMREALDAVDWSKVERHAATATDREHVRIALRFAERPEGMDHLKPVWSSYDKTWFVGVRSSSDLFASPQLAPVVEAAYAVLAEGERVGTPTDTGR